jgi:predicted Ser/Thr protein kinase
MCGVSGVEKTLAGRYELLDVLGRGGMGVVYRARDRLLDRVVAVKVLPADRAEDSTLVTRFEREARSAAALGHPNIVAVFDTGCDQSTRFIVMEYVSGRSLAQLLRQQEGPLAPARAVEITARIASALAAAHSKGIIHRDIKPGNVMIDSAGSVKVLDFGIARAVTNTSLTQTAVVLGSVAYLAPEVSRGEPADERSDIYSLGCVLYELLTGRPPFTGELPAAIMHQHNARQPTAARDLNPEVPIALNALSKTMLAKRPRDRPQHARELPGLLAAAIDASTTPATAHALPAAIAAGGTAPTRVLPRPRRFARREAIAVAAGVALILLVVLLAVLPGSGSPDRRAGRPSVTAQHTTSTRTSGTRTSSSGTALRPTASTTPTPASTTPAAPATVPTAAAELTRLATQDLQSGTIDQPASQTILNHLQDILNSYSMGHTADAVHEIGDLTQQITQLSQHGDIHPSALPAINTAISSLSSALARAAPITTASGPTPGQPGAAAPAGPGAKGPGAKGPGHKGPGHKGPKVHPPKPGHH